jgi:hypothetical protein
MHFVFCREDLPQNAAEKAASASDQNSQHVRAIINESSLGEKGIAVARRLNRQAAVVSILGVWRILYRHAIAYSQPKEGL